MIIFLFKY